MRVLLRFMVFLMCSPGISVGWSAAPPNIVMIVSDDQAWTDYGFMGHPHIRTPHLDRLASESLVFPRGYVPSSLCCPSLASIITGLYPHQHKVTSNDPPMPAVEKPRNTPEFAAGREVMARHLERVPTLPRLLAGRDYVSLQTGKWWQGHFSRGGFTQGMTLGTRHGDAGLEIGRKTLRPIFDFIGNARREQKPFFIWYAPMMPHQPHNPPERFLQKYRDKTNSLHVAKYWATVEWFDETCGTLLDYIDREGLRENTIVVYVTDNGWIQDPAADKYLPSKQSPYDAGLRTPIMVRWPGRVAPGRSPHLASSLDLAPTLLRAAGLSPTRDMPGVDLLDARAVKRRKAIFGECFTHDAVDLHDPAKSVRWRWMIEGDWKLILPDPVNEPGAQPELYRLSSDPHETSNAASREPRRIAQMTRKINQWWDARR